MIKIYMFKINMKFLYKSYYLLSYNKLYLFFVIYLKL